MNVRTLMGATSELRFREQQPCLRTQCSEELSEEKGHYGCRKVSGNVDRLCNSCLHTSGREYWICIQEPTEHSPGLRVSVVMVVSYDPNVVKHLLSSGSSTLCLKLCLPLLQKWLIVDGWSQPDFS